MRSGRLLSGVVEICSFEAEPVGDHCLATLTSRISEDFLSYFEHYEQLANAQSFTHIDQLDSEMETWKLAVAWNDGEVVRIARLQDWPSQGQFSFFPA